jgi:hypothetical protein
MVEGKIRTDMRHGIAMEEGRWIEWVFGITAHMV